METKEKTTEQIAEYFMQKYGKLATDVAQELLANAMQNLKLAKELDLGFRAEGLASGDIKCWSMILDFIIFNQGQR